MRQFYDPRTSKNTGKKIFKMTATQVEAYRIKISVSTADSKAKKLLCKACDARMANCDTHHAMVEMGDISDMGGF